MTSTHVPSQRALSAPDPYVLATDEGPHFHFLNHLATVKVAGADSGSMSVVQFVGTRGFGPPLHRHNHEDELFVVLEGEMRFFSGDLEIDGGAGAHAFLPHGQPHTFQVMSETATFTNVTSSREVVPQFDEMVSTLGEATNSFSLPEATPIDPARVAEVCAYYGIDVLGPPPSMEAI
ncbi:MAG: cupin domain-containing protein [Acidimicrobiia bacterium]